MDHISEQVEQNWENHVTEQKQALNNWDVNHTLLSFNFPWAPDKCWVANVSSMLLTWFSGTLMSWLGRLMIERGCTTVSATSTFYGTGLVLGPLNQQRFTVDPQILGLCFFLVHMILWNTDYQKQYMYEKWVKYKHLSKTAIVPDCQFCLFLS